MYFEMLRQYKMFLVFVVISISSRAIAEEGRKCNITQLSFTYTNGTSNLLNFTEQSFPIDGKPFYYSWHGGRSHGNSNGNQTIVHWSNKTSSWLVQRISFSIKEISFLVPVFIIKKSWKHLGFPNVSDWVELWKDDKVVIKSRCLIFNNMCLAKREDNLKIEDTRAFVKATALGQCIFPFKHKNVSYSSCTLVDADDGFWCATSVDANLDWQTWGNCMNNTTCPLKGRI